MVKTWDCSLSLSIGSSNGGGRSVIVDMAAMAANVIGRVNGFVYGQHFIVKKVKPDEIILGFNTPEERDAAARNICKNEGVADPCPDCG